MHKDCLHLWYSKTPCEPKYLQISHSGLDTFCKNTIYDFQKFRSVIHDHHAQPVTKDGMFIFEQFFGGDVLDLVADYLKSEGYTIKANYQDLEAECIVEGYDGILVHWSW